MPPKFIRKSNGGASAGRSAYNSNSSANTEEVGMEGSRKWAEIARSAEIDSQMGFPPLSPGAPKTLVPDGEWPSGKSGVDYYFLAEDGSCFKATLTYSPYFFIKCKNGRENEVEEFLRRKFGNTIESMRQVMKEDLDLPNHLSGLQRRYIRLNFRNVNDLMAVRRVTLPLAMKNAETYKEDAFSSEYNSLAEEGRTSTEDTQKTNASVHIVGLREHDLPYHLRVAIDLDIRVGLWYSVMLQGPSANIQRLTSKDVRPDPVILAFDIETSKMPLKFPDASQDHIMMISYMINGRGFLIVNRDIVGEDIENFEYTPKPDFPGIFHVTNVDSEEALIKHFFTHIQLVRPQVFVTYNGDFFDWPFIEKRAGHYGIDMKESIGIAKNSQDEYCGNYCVHMDCFCWVKRDSYLPAGSHGLKAVCSIKLGYDPLELDPELMTPLARSDPHTLANYSVSDAVATYYLYMKYVHPFIFSLCNIIPLMPDEVLRKGTGTLCETLLMAQAFKANVIMPNKHEDSKEKFHKGHLLESETYIGGHVEALEAGVYRSDFQYRFKINPQTINQLCVDLDRALRFFIEHESKISIDQVTNYDEIYNEIKKMLEDLTIVPQKLDYPLIYHLDVGSMYPNIILTNRLQPSAMVSESTCAVCDYNLPGKECQRKMTWSWRGEYYSAKLNEYKMIKKQLESERFPSKINPSDTIPFHELFKPEQDTLLRKRLSDYSQKVYKRIRQNEVIQQTSIVCQRENSFYIDTVRSFRDRRYDYKNLQKIWKKKLDEATLAKEATKIEEASKLLVLYDSLQLAHKCILNSFYGYVMRKAARWYSMEMGGIVCETGAAIITLARQLIEQFGRPLELDTDGIWCMLPSGFPQNFTFSLIGGKKLSFAYPCVMLNHLLFDKFTNHQYQTLTDPEKRIYEVSSENSIFFEIDGPYKAMVLPSSTEEGRQLKKRYAVFNEDGSLAELKGFEIKRRGELKLVKIFQSQIFKTFLGGSNLVECYQEAATVANYWLDILYSKGASLQDFELIELISENRSMSKSLEEYGEQKSTSISTAKRLAEFLGDAMVKDKGLACKFIISLKPAGQPVANRAIPVAIFSAAPEVKRHYLSKWLQDPSLAQSDIRELIDWDYYIERLGSMIQKLLVIPAAMQNVSNPVPRVIPPEWLKKGADNRLNRGGGEQRKLTEMFASMKRKAAPDMEDVLLQGDSRAASLVTAFLPSESKVTKVEETAKSTTVTVAVVDINKDYGGWIASKKKEWIQRVKDLSKSPIDSSGRSTIGNFFKNDRFNIEKTPWEIISFSEVDGQAGHFTLWALIGPYLRSFRIECPRRIYFSTQEPLSDEVAATCNQVHFRLASGHAARNLYEVSMSEKVYLEEFIPNATNLLDPLLEGLYETSIPLSFKMLVEMGAVASVKKDVVKKSTNNVDYTFTPYDFNFSSTSEVPYLTAPQLVYAYCGLVKADSRSVIIFSLSDSPTLRILIIDDGMRRQVAALKTVVAQVFKSLMDGQVASTGPFMFTEEPLCEVDYYTDFESAQRSIIRLLNVYLDDRPNPTILLTSGSTCPIITPKIMPRLPIISIQNIASGSFILPPLDWQRAGVKHLCELYYGALNDWMGKKLNYCRHVHVPFGYSATLDEKEEISMAANVFLARLHKQQGYLLPWRDRADLFTKSVTSSMLQETSLQIDNSGMFRHVSVQFSLSQVALNSVMEYSHLCQEGESPPPILSLLRSLITGWLKEVLHFQNDYSTKLVQYLYQWLLSDTSPIISGCPSIAPLLNRLIDRSLDKLFDYLKHIGCALIHGSQHLLVISTSKDRVENAQAFVNYILDDLKKVDGLAWVEITPVTYWKSLLWLSEADYAGVPVGDEDTEEKDSEEGIVIKSSIGDYLPPIMQRPFEILIADYVMQAKEINPVTARQIALKNDDLHVKSLLIDEEDSESMVEGDELVEDEKMELISLDYRKKFLQIVRDIQKYMATPVSGGSEEKRRMRQFPMRLGSHLNPQRSPTVEFVKSLGAMITLDKLAYTAAFKLVKQAFMLLGVREFSDEVRWIHPCHSFLLPNTICLSCNNVFNLDLSRDDAAPLNCPFCSVTMNKELIEERLFSVIKGRLLAYQTQDLQCSKCKGIKVDNMKGSCNCSGNYLLLENVEQFKLDVIVLKRIAVATKMTSLVLFFSTLII